MIAERPKRLLRERHPLGRDLAERETASLS
jgi:hypothetical protein